MTTTPCRRQFVCGSLAVGSVVAPWRFVNAVLPPTVGLGGAVPIGRALRTSSKVISAYVVHLTWLDAEVPGEWRQLFEQYAMPLASTGDSPEKERRRAEYLSFAAVRIFAARALRNASVHDLAQSCEVAGDLDGAGRAASLAQHAIGSAHCYTPLVGTMQCAYGAAAHAANAVNTARAEDRWVPDTGKRAAAALLNFAESLLTIGDEATQAWDLAGAVLDGAVAVAIDG
jgi:hypothetical protein